MEAILQASGGYSKASLQSYELFTRDPLHPGLNFEQVNKRLDIWSARVNEGYRVLGYRDGGEIHWFWIGTHREYEKLISRR